jgi:cysteinyl-tRNA synthetase
VKEGEREVVRAFTSLEDAERRLDYFYSTLARLDDWARGPGAGVTADGEVAPEAAALAGKMREAMNDDFNTAQMLADLGEGMKLANRLLDQGGATPPRRAQPDEPPQPIALPKDVKKRTLARLSRDLRELPVAIGLLARPPREFLDARRARLVTARGLDAAAIERRLAERDAARKAKDFGRSDELRAQLKAEGVEVMDGPTGATWRVVD